ncbi:MAG: hypothetical protein EOP92_01425 [Lysobacteraceae bacterium]|nr:MAG: hypothetical protein EOP92_01425 [Xanthomonadaceae bacterium]
MTDPRTGSSSAGARGLLAILGILFAALAGWAWLDALRFPPWSLPACAALAVLFLGLARWASDRWVERLRGLLTGWP